MRYGEFHDVVGSACLHDGEVLDSALVHQWLGGDAERPMWAVVDATLSGQVAKALRLFHAGGEAPAHALLGALAGELRRALCCLSSRFDRLEE